MNKYIKYLVESFIDDEDIEEIYDDGILDKHKQIDLDKFYNEISNGLWTLTGIQLESRYPEDFPKLKQDPKDPNKLYVLPMVFYKSNVYRVRNRKKYTLDYFYKFTLINNLDGTFDLLENRNSERINMIFSEEWLRLLESDILRIRNYGYRDGQGNILNEKIPKFLIFSPSFGTGKYTDNMIRNFPEHIILGPSEDCKNIKMYSYKFESKEKYYELIKKIVSSGYTVADENDIIYTEETFNSSKQTLEDLERQKEQEKENKFNKAKLFILEQFYSADHQTILTALDNISKSGKKPYIYSLNSSKNNAKKTGKLTALYTLQLILKDNNMLSALLSTFESFLINDEYDIDVKEPNDLYRVILFKLIQNTHKLNLARYGSRYYKDEDAYLGCFRGIEKEWAGGYYFKKYDMNDIPLGLGKFDMLYDLYYVIAYTLVNIKGLTKFDRDSIISYTNNINPDLSTFNFKSLNDTILNILKLYI